MRWTTNQMHTNPKLNRRISLVIQANESHSFQSGVNGLLFSMKMTSPSIKMHTANYLGITK